MMKKLILIYIIFLSACTYHSVATDLGMGESLEDSLDSKIVIEDSFELPNQCTGLQETSPVLTFKEICFADLYCTEFNYTHFCVCEEYCTCFFKPGGITFLPMGFCELDPFVRISVHFAYVNPEW